MNKFEVTPFWKAVRRTLLSTSPTSKASLLKWLTKDRRLSFSPCFICKKLNDGHLCLWLPMKLLMSNLLNSLNEGIVFGGSLLNHYLPKPFNLVGKALHMISSRIPWRYIVVLNVAT